MGRLAAAGAVAALAACGRLDFDPLPTVDAPPASCSVGPNIQVSNAAGTSNGPTLAGNGTGFALAWADNRDGNFEIYLSLFDAAGTPIATELRMTNTAAASIAPTVGWSGATWGLAWSEALGGNSYQTMFQQLAPDGTPLGAAKPLAMQTSTFVPGRAQKWIDTSYALAWQADVGGPNDEIFFARLGEDGTPITTDQQLTMAAGGSGFPTLAWTGSEFGITWNDDRDGNTGIYFAAVDATGQKLTGDLRVTADAASTFVPGIERTGDHFLVTYWDDRTGTSEIYQRLLDDTGAPLGDEQRLNPGHYGQVPIARWSGRELGLIWADFRNNILEPYFTRTDGDGVKLGDDQRVSTGGIDMELDGHDVAWTGSSFAIAWGDKRSGDVEIYAAIASCP